jgi:hypothetical protein
VNKEFPTLIVLRHRLTEKQNSFIIAAEPFVGLAFKVAALPVVESPHISYSRVALGGFGV